MNSPLGSWYLPYVIAKHWRGVTNRRRLLIFGILSPAVSYLLFHLELKEADPSAVLKTCELSPRNQGGLGKASGEYPRLCKTEEIFSSEPFHCPTWRRSWLHCCTNEEMEAQIGNVTYLPRTDRAKMTLEIIYANFSLTCLPPNTRLLPGCLLLCQIARQQLHHFSFTNIVFFPLTASG